MAERACVQRLQKEFRAMCKVKEESVPRFFLFLVLFSFFERTLFLLMELEGSDHHPVEV
jgi:hypothetical protein